MSRVFEHFRDKHDVEVLADAYHAEQQERLWYEEQEKKRASSYREVKKEKVKSLLERRRKAIRDFKKRNTRILPF